MREPRLARFEEDLKRVPGVKGARVVGDEAPSEIHIVAVAGRSPKQVVRDVQSLAAAGFGFPIDHRIVSIVQLEDGAEHVPSSSNGASIPALRPVLERVVLATKGDEGWVKVGLKWPDDQVTEGVAAAGVSREARARAASDAVSKALDPILAPMKARMAIDQVAVSKIGVSDSVTVSVLFYEGGTVTPLVGSAIIQDDVASAAVRATLQAVNRRLR
jgi:hypothetical protein